MPKNVERVLQTISNKNLEKLKDTIRYKSIVIVEQKEIEKILEKVKGKEKNQMTLAQRIRKLDENIIKEVQE